MFAVPGVQREGLPYKEGGRCRAEADTYPLVDTDHVEDDDNAQQELRAFIEKADMPAGCTLLGLSALPTEHPLNKGMLGMHGNQSEIGIGTEGKEFLHCKLRGHRSW